ncbi:MAG: pyridine nucleotide-disulfide oxidoreductase [Sphingomonadales bacterium 32-68-7]|nr:MAG: pyridine nucleotide-disulfide oxidoreductase [Sphingomonadales bacterium 12-68-11]OYX07466.1 MAG: pyridine nucleotide-disulfide oxidoreductase [Sphingomonadales bacterium 32-68-7]
MRHLAIIGSGPAGYYTAEAAQKAFGDDIAIDVFDRLPVPYGLIRSGVAPDHQSIKAVSRRYEKVALSDNVRFVGNVSIGRDLSIDELRELYDAVVLATGAPHDRPLDIPGESLGNVFGSAAFVGWYNGHPQFAGLDPDLSGKTAVVIGMGNVALDVARILAKTPAEFAGSDIVAHALAALARSSIERIVLLGRRGPHQIMMTPKELGELGHLTAASPYVTAADLPPPDEDAILEPGVRKSVAHLRAFAATPEDIRAEKAKEIEFVFMSNPKALIGKDKVEAVEIERTFLNHGRAEGTGELRRIPADLVVACIGYRTSPIEGVPFDERAGRFANDAGRILPGLYCVGWARRGPSGTIGTNRPDGYAVAEQIADDVSTGVLGAARKKGRPGFDALAAERGLEVVKFSDWKKIEEAEEQAAREGAPREKFVDVEAMIRAGR